MPDLPEDIDSKISELRTLIESAPSPDKFAELADLLRTTNKLQQAKEICLRGLELYPDDPGCLMCYARVLMDSGEFEEAKKVLTHLEEIGKEDVGVLLLLGQLFTQNNDFSGLYNVAKKLAENYPDDVRAKKFLQFLKSKGLLGTVRVNSSGEQGSASSPEAGRVEVETAVESAPGSFKSSQEYSSSPRGGQDSAAPARAVPPESEVPGTVPTLPLEDLMHIAALLKGIVGVEYVVILTVDNKTLASKGCPDNVARPVGALVLTLKKALSVAFPALEFGRWIRGVAEFEGMVIHIIEKGGYYFALACDPKISMGALRLAVSTILSRYF